MGEGVGEGVVEVVRREMVKEKQRRQVEGTKGKAKFDLLQSPSIDLGN